MPYLRYLKNLKQELFIHERRREMPRRRLKILLASLWLSSVIAIIVLIPDYARYQRRIEHIEHLLQANCAAWSAIKDESFIPFNQPLATKCLPKTN